MTELLDASLAFPTIVLTILVGVIALYWITVILGALDIDIFASDADFDGALDGDFSDGGGGDADVGDADAGEGHVEASTFFAPLGLRRVPLTISVTFIAFFSWSICLLALHYLAPWIPAGTPGLLIGLAVLLGSVIVSLPLTAIIITPLAPAFVVHKAMRRTDNIGSTCTVTTGRVDENFGQAKITCNGAELVLPVRCDDHSNNIDRGDKALVIDYDDDREAYLIEPLTEVFQDQLKEEQ